MKILLVNKFHYLKGGSEKYYFELGNLLIKNGHEVAYFSMKDDRNIDTGCLEYFVDQIDFATAPKSKAFDVIYSKQNAKLMETAINEFKPDIIHLNNFQRQLSASIVKIANKHQIPLVYTAHDLQAICPAIVMLDNENNLCDKCINQKFINCIKGNCCKGSKMKSILGAVEGYYYQYNNIYEKIDAIITPSHFFNKKMVENGFNKVKIHTKHNFLLDINQYDVKINNDGYFLYIGRISREKGIFDLLDAMKLNDSKLIIGGAGPEVDNMLMIIKENNLQDRVEYVGFLNQEDVIKYVSNCTALIVPSTWYENCPYSVLEAIAIGKPIIGSKIGGIPELVIDGETGLLFDSGDSKKLSELINILDNDADLYTNLSKNAKIVSGNYSEGIYYQNLLNIYKKIK